MFKQFNVKLRSVSFLRYAMKRRLCSFPRPALLSVALGCLFLLPAICHAQGGGGNGGGGGGGGGGFGSGGIGGGGGGFGGVGGGGGFGGKLGFNGGSGL